MSHFVIGVVVPANISVGMETVPNPYAGSLYPQGALDYAPNETLDEYLTRALDPFDENKSVDIWQSKDDLVTAERARIIDLRDHGAYAEFVELGEAGYFEKYPHARENPRHVHWLTAEMPEMLEKIDDDEYIYKTHVLKYVEDEDVRESDGAVHTTYNPKSKWDWWVIGGRWEGAYREYQGETVKAFLKHVADIDPDSDNSRVPYSMILPLENGEFEWIERGQMGWFGMSRDHTDASGWRGQLQQRLGQLDPASKIVYLDLHI